MLDLPNLVHDDLRDRIRSAPRTDLDRIVNEVWAQYAAGRLNDGEAQSLADLAHNRRRGPQKPVGRARAPMRPRSTDHRSGLAHSLFMPVHLKAKFSLAELAALRIVADEYSAHGLCDRSIGEIAARAGVGRTSAQNAIRRARAMGLVSVEERRIGHDRNDTNVIHIVSPEWTTWLRLRQRRTGNQEKTRQRPSETTGDRYTPSHTKATTRPVLHGPGLARTGGGFNFANRLRNKKM